MKGNSKKINRKKYDHKTTEDKWQVKWENEKIYKAKDFDKNEKFYQLVEFPYPSGVGLHVGHIRSWASMDAYVRRLRMKGKNVLFPIGWDAFGLPAENYAIKTGIHPQKTVTKNIDTFKRQIKSLSLSFDWDRQVNTTNPKYYKWTQWIFIQLFKSGLAYQKKVAVNWCPHCQTNLADEEVTSDGKHERCQKPTQKRMQKQWLLRITKYADRLIDDLKKVDYSPSIEKLQKNWIGRKKGINITYEVEKTDNKISVWTSRPDTNFGATFVVMAPEHPFLNKENIPSKYYKDVFGYINKAKNKSELERISEGRKKSGVFTGLYCLNRLTGKKMPLYVADFVLMNVGTGAVVGVPGHDKRDFEFATAFGLPVVRVVVGEDGDNSEITKIQQVHETDGKMINSGFLNGLDTSKAIDKMMNYLEEKGWGERSVSFHLRDWVFSRQHYWGEPIPMVFCDKCAKVGKSWFDKSSKMICSDQSDWDHAGWFPVENKDLPVELPFMKSYKPSGTGKSPLENRGDWLEVKCPNCSEKATRETDTMPNWAGSNWYYIRYLDPNNNQEIASKKKMKYWLPVDFYQGGVEHITLHLLYSRFIYKFLYDIGVVPTSEPYAKRRSHGIVLGSDGRKMSKSFGNVINPDEIVEKYGADSIRLYEMFIGPFDQTVAWSHESMEGCFRFIRRLWVDFNGRIGQKTSQELSIKLNQTIKKVDEDIKDLKFNTAVASLMEFANSWEQQGTISHEDAKRFCLLLAPFAPHLTEQVWNEVLEEKFSVHQAKWPEYDPKLIKDKLVEIAVQVNGKLRSTVVMDSSSSKVKEKVINKTQDEEKIQKWLEGKKIARVIFVAGKLVNFVV